MCEADDEAREMPGRRAALRRGAGTAREVAFPRVDLRGVDLAELLPRFASDFGGQLVLAQVHEIAMLLEERQRGAQERRELFVKRGVAAERGQRRLAQAVDAAFERVAQNVVLRLKVQIDGALGDSGL